MRVPRCYHGLATHKVKAHLQGSVRFYLVHDGQNSFLGPLFWKVKSFNSLLAAFSQWALLKVWAHNSFTYQTHLIIFGWGGRVNTWQPAMANPPHCSAVTITFLTEWFKWSPACKTQIKPTIWNPPGNSIVSREFMPLKGESPRTRNNLTIQWTNFSEWAILFFHRQIPF